MKRRFVFGIFAAFLTVFTFASPTYASVQDFEIRDFQADYYLDKDNDGRSTLKTVEYITAIFPNVDQNHGIERVIPFNYDKHYVSLKIDSVKDEGGVGLNYTTYKSNDNLVIRIGDADKYVRGTKVYIITYTQKDVTRYFKNTNDDEFYWDTNGTEWSQPFGKVTATIHLGDKIKNSLNGETACYYGLVGSDAKCEITKKDNIITATASDLKIGENMTFAIGFKSKTFSDYEMTLAEKIERNITDISLVIAAIFLLIMIPYRLIIGRGAKGRGIIVPEYLPPKDVDVATAAYIMRKTRKWVAATYIDLAVKHKIKVIQNGKKSYSLEITNMDGLSSIENQVIQAVFGGDAKVGSSYKIDPNDVNTTLARKLQDIYSDVKDDTKTNGYIKVEAKSIITILVLTIIPVLQSVACWLIYSNSVLAEDPEAMFFIAFCVASIGIIMAVTLRPLTEKGRELSDYLKGLKTYIKVAEEERIKMLQSPQGAEKTPIKTDDDAQMVRLYERVLPYAIIFGQEKNWSKLLGEYYERLGQNPDWYSGSGAFNSIMLTSALSSFSSVVANNSYISSSSSSSGGSGGGGFSGGGGGGGGGGGW